MSAQSEDLFDSDGRRLYLTLEERQACLKAAKKADRPVRSFCHTLHSTGCRISEALQLTPERVDLAAQLVTFETLKQRRRKVYRAVPVPPGLSGRPGHGTRPERASQALQGRRSTPYPLVVLVADDGLPENHGSDGRRRHRGRPP